ncbi:hypothetical protein EON65_09630 [archaeon]|nr:MAG: hypothetical protein EON65_09630 [archaeon]
MGNKAVSFDSGAYRYTSGASSTGKKLSSPAMQRKRMLSSDSIERDDYGWYDDFEPSPGVEKVLSAEFPHQQPLQRALTLPAPAAEPPLYILESSLETQQLWYTTAGRRPKQPEQEREYFEKLWAENFEQSSVSYNNNPSETPAGKKSRIVDNIPYSELQGEIVFRGKSPFSNSVSKSFVGDRVASMTLQMPYYRIVRSLLGDLHAEYMVVVTLGGNVPVTFGIWKRHSDFSRLAKELMERNMRSYEENAFKNSLLSWQCVLQRKRWFKSLDRDYLALKCFLLERFMHDLLFEAQAPKVLNRFLGLE